MENQANPWPIIVVTAVLVSATACTAKTDESSPALTNSAPFSADPSPSAAASRAVSPDHVIPTTPFKYASADQIVRTWTAKWHRKIQVIQTKVERIRRITIDNPFGRGTLQMDV